VVDPLLLLGVALDLLVGQLAPEEHRQDLTVALAGQARGDLGRRMLQVIARAEDHERLGVEAHVIGDRAVHVEDGGVEGM